MAGDWIKIQSVTPDKPEVFAIAEQLGLDPDTVVGKLVRIWIWADQQTVNGNAASVTLSLPERYRSVTKTLLDRVSGVSGFAQAMLDVGWLVEEETGFIFPNFDRHNGNTAKTRALTAKRVANHKEGKQQSGNALSVTSALPREEKRREENNNTHTHGRGRCSNLFIPENLSQSSAFMDAFDAWIENLFTLTGIVNRPQLETHLVELSRMGAGRAVEVIRYSIGKGGKYLYTDAPDANGNKPEAARKKVVRPILPNREAS